MESMTKEQLRPKGAIGIYIVHNSSIFLLLRNSNHAGGATLYMARAFRYKDKEIEVASWI